MPIAEENSPPYTDAEYYGVVLTGLFGVIEDAEASDCDPEGIALLREARDLFWAGERSARGLVQSLRSVRAVLLAPYTIG